MLELRPRTTFRYPDGLKMILVCVSELLVSHVPDVTKVDLHSSLHAISLAQIGA
jgi:hypothetical protein